MAPDVLYLDHLDSWLYAGAPAARRSSSTCTTSIRRSRIAPGVKRATRRAAATCAARRRCFGRKEAAAARARAHDLLLLGRRSRVFPAARRIARRRGAQRRGHRRVSLAGGARDRCRRRPVHRRARLDAERQRRALPRRTGDAGGARARPGRAALDRRPPSDARSAGARGSRDAVEIAADVPDVRPYWERASLLAVPLEAGGGTRIKILESFAAGVPVVSTPVGCEGIAGRHGEHLLVAPREAVRRRGGRRADRRRGRGHARRCRAAACRARLRLVGDRRQGDGARAPRRRQTARFAADPPACRSRQR